MTRRDTFLSICAATDALAIDPMNGWPGRATVTLADGLVQEVLIHAGPLTTHARGIVGEVRVQPPGRNCPVQDDPVAIPLVLGIATTNILVAVDAYRHIGSNKRWTVTFRENLVTEATQFGWARSERPIYPRGIELIYAFHASLLPLYVEMVARRVSIESSLLRATVAGTGLIATPNDTSAKERARRATSRLVRDAAFSRDVREAYGHECALCGLGLGLVVGAHVLPASAPNSPDEVSNGICLCENHHRAFDKHLIYIEPATLRVKLHSSIHEEAIANAAARSFINGTTDTLRRTENQQLNVSDAMLSQRYEYFTGLYDWAE